MAELGIIASVVQIADVGLRLSIKLYTFGEIVASADRSVISISKDVSLTSGVLKELGQILDKDKETRTFSENAVQTADGVVKECLEVFQEMENILVKKMPSLAKGEGRDGKSGERTKRAMVMLERLRWGYLQPKLQLLRSNLDRLKSTLLLMLHVITYARQVSAKTESPSVIAEQRSLIEDLAHSNQEYMHKFEKLKLGVEESTVEDMYDASSIGAIEREPSTSTRSLPGALTRKSEKIKFATGGTPLEDEDNAPSLGSRKLTTARRSSPKAQISATRTLATPPNASINNVFINTSVQTNIAMPPVQERGIPTIEAPIGFDQEVVFKQLEHYSMLITNLLKEVDEAQYKITFKSRLRVKGGIAGLHEGERQELEKTWGCTALQSAEQRLESLVEGLGELPRMNSFAARDTVQMSSPDNMSRTGTLPSLATEPGPDSREQDEAAVWISQAKSDGRRPYVNPGTWSSRMQIPVSNAVTKESQSIDVPEKSPYEWMARSYASIVPLADSENYTEISDPDLLDLMEDPRSEESPTPVVDVNAKPAEEGSIKQGNAITSGKMKNQVLARKDVKGLALREHIRPSSHARKVEDLDHSPKYSQIPEGFSMPIDFGEDQRVKTQPANKEDGNVLGEHVCQSQEELNAKLASKRGWKAADNLESTKEGDPTAQTTNSQTVSPVDLMVNLESASVIAPEAALPLKKIVTNCSPVWVNDNEVPIVPFSDREWGEIINMQIPSLSHRDTLDDYDDEVDFANVDDAKSGKNAESSRRDTDHVNLGLADMEVVDRLVFLWTTVKPS